MGYIHVVGGGGRSTGPPQTTLWGAKGLHQERVNESSNYRVFELTDGVCIPLHTVHSLLSRSKFDKPVHFTRKMIGNYVAPIN